MRTAHNACESDAGKRDQTLPNQSVRVGIHSGLTPMQSRVAESCDTLVALGDVTADGGVLLAKNSDRRAHEAQRLISCPASDHASGAMLRCQYLEIPQVAHTHALIGSQPYWLWGFEHGMNEWGLAIGNEAIFTRAPIQEIGLLGMDLVRLGLERSQTAQKAVDTITTLLEEYGQGGSAEHHFARYYDNSFLIADPLEAWILETCGRHWAARRITAGTAAISNCLTLGTNYDAISHGFAQQVIVQGWSDSEAGATLDIGRAVSDPDNPGLPHATCRLERMRHRLTSLPVSSVTPQTMMELLRDHGPASDPADRGVSWPDGTQAATVCWHGTADQSESSTAASMVAHLRPNQMPMYWASMAPPCTGIFIPCWVDSGLPGALTLADETPAAGSAWWMFRHLWESIAASPDPAAAVHALRRSWEPLAARIHASVAQLDFHASQETRAALTQHALDDAWTFVQEQSMLHSEYAPV